MGNTQRVKTAKRYLGYIRDSLNGFGQFSSKYIFINRKRNKQKLLYILAGYKSYLWEDVFSRIDKFCPADVEVCILSSGIHSDELERYAKKYEWSYLSTERNNICCITNILLKIYEKAEFIYKMDEDIYLTEGCFEELFRIYSNVLSENRYKVGIVGAFIPINSFCLYKFLKDGDKYEDFVAKFGWFNDGCAEDDSLRERKGINAYIWECTSNIDEYARTQQFQRGKYYEVNCRYMIGFILFKRQLWEEMGGLKVMIGKGSGDEGDEGQLLSYCFLKSRVILCAKGAVAGHFSYGGCEEEVLDKRKSHPEWFVLTEK